MKVLIPLLLLLNTGNAFASAPKDSSDRFIVQTLRGHVRKLETARAVFWFQHEGKDSLKIENFMADVNHGIETIEEFTGIRFDSAFYGTDKIEYFISDYTTVSHVYQGYHHNSGDRKPYVFFSARRFHNNMLPWLHETTHLILRDFHALWLREGMAEWVAAQVAEILGKGHIAFYGSQEETDVHQLAAGIEQHYGKDIILNLVGTNGIPGFKDAEIRRMFYIASTSFVGYLAGFLPKSKLLELYLAGDTRNALEKLMNKNTESIKQDWMHSLPAIDPAKQKIPQTAGF